MWIVLLVASIVILILIGIVIAIQNQQIGRTSRTSFFQEYSADFPKNLNDLGDGVLSRRLPAPVRDRLA